MDYSHPANTVIITIEFAWGSRAQANRHSRCKNVASSGGGIMHVARSTRVPSTNHWPFNGSTGAAESQKDRARIAFILAVAGLAVVLAGCVESPPKKTSGATARPAAVRTESSVLANTLPGMLGEGSGPISMNQIRFGHGRTGFAEQVTAVRFVEQPSPIPGRLLVKIDRSEIAKRFKPEPQNCDVARLRELGLIPSAVEISNAQFVAITGAKKAALRINFKRPIDYGVVAKAFSETKSSLSKDSAIAVKDGWSDRVLVLVDPEALNITEGRPCPPRYFYLKDNSRLHGLFREIGVQSMRRIFRSAEKPDPQRPGYFRVIRIADLLHDARQSYPQRSLRAYQDIEPSTNMENWFLVRLDSDANLRAAISGLRVAEIEDVSADYPFISQTAQNQPYWPDQWGLNNTGSLTGVGNVLPAVGGGVNGFDINIQQAWSDPTPSGSVVVAVIDAGFKEDLTELANRLWTNAGDPPGDADGDGIDDDDCNGYIDDVHGITSFDRWEVDYGLVPDCTVYSGGPAVPMDLGRHGTKVAGIIAADVVNESSTGAAIAGTAGPIDVQLMNISVGTCTFGDGFMTGSAEVAEGIYYANLKNADIANLSIATRVASTLLRETVNDALVSGLILVASAGNENRRFLTGPNSFVHPASLRGVIAVGGATRAELRWPSSNYGPGLDLVAPASQVLTLDYDINNPTQTIADVVAMSGTSASAAFVSGAAAVSLSKYPDLTAPYMRHWLRATARDMTDPNGTGIDNLVGFDELTGAGMLNAGLAITALDPTNLANDGPLDVDILVERLRQYHRTNYLPTAVAGQPELAIKVQGLSTASINSTVKEWRLEYTQGDNIGATSWTQIQTNDCLVDATLCPIEVPSPFPPFESNEFTSGFNYLDTDPLSNNQIYTLRLVAKNLADQEFVATHVFTPARSKITVPAPNITIVGRWGWPPIWGVTDIRSGTDYRVKFVAPSSTDWETLPIRTDDVSNAMRLLSWLPSNWGQSASAHYQVLWSRTFPDTFSNVSPENAPEEWVSYRLSVNSPSNTQASNPSTDTVNLYLDNSHFDYKLPPILLKTWSGFKNKNDLFNGSVGEDVAVADMGGGLGQRIFVHKSDTLWCLDATGSPLWSIPLRIYDISSIETASNRPWMAIRDVDGDSIKEILVAGTDPTYTFWAGPPVLYLLRHDGFTGYSTGPAGDNPNWPKTLSSPGIIEYHGGFPGKVHIADVTGGPEREIIFYHPRNYYNGVPVAEIRDGFLRVLDKEGNDVAPWPLVFSAATAPSELRIRIGNLDADPKAEILLDSGHGYDGDKTPLSGWNGGLTGNPRVRLFDIDEMTSELEALQYGTRYCYPDPPGCTAYSLPDYEVNVFHADGILFPGNWPLIISTNVVTNPEDPYSSKAQLFAIAGQVVATGNKEIILCDNEIRVYDTSANPIPLSSPINLGGHCGGIQLLNVDTDPAEEFVVLVHRYKIATPGIRRGSFIEAYDLDGRRLGDSDNRWPLVVPWDWRIESQRSMFKSITFADTDDDGFVEAIQVTHSNPYGEVVLPTAQNGDSRIEILNLQSP